MVEVVKAAYITRTRGDDDFIFIFISRVDFYIKFRVFPFSLYFFLSFSPSVSPGILHMQFPRGARAGLSLRVEERGGRVCEAWNTETL